MNVVAARLPRRLGRYVLRETLAEGGMAVVFLAEHRTSDGFHKWIAIKTMREHLMQDDGLLKMFFDESRLTAQLDHPNVCTVFDFGETDGTWYLAMEFLRGQPLSAVMRRMPDPSRISPVIAAKIIAGAARGLHFAHDLRDAQGASAGVVHRDVSPQNIMVLYSGAVKVMDFGIARFADRIAERTADDSIRGKTSYLAPEQFRHEDLDRRTDIFALGVVLWEMTVGARLFHRGTNAATLSAAMAGEVPRPSTLVEGYPSVLEEIVMRATARDRSMRFQTADEMTRSLEAFLSASSAVGGDEVIADFMASHFQTEMNQREASLRRLRTESVDVLPAISISAPDGNATRKASVTDVADETKLERPKPRSPWPLIATVGILAVVAFVALRIRSAEGPPQVRPNSFEHPVISVPPITAQNTPVLIPAVVTPVNVPDASITVSPVSPRRVRVSPPSNTPHSSQPTSSGTFAPRTVYQ